jgi:predicted double-glycine peptidase
MVKFRIWSIASALVLMAALLTGRSFAEKVARTQHVAIGVSARVDVGKRHDHVAKERGPVRSAAIRQKTKSGHAQYAAEKVRQPADMGKRHDHVAKERGPVRSAAIRQKTKSGHAQYAVKRVPPRADTRMDIDREPNPVRSLLEIRRENVMIQNWDLSCGAAALGTLLRYEFGEPVTEKEIARGLMSRGEYIEHPELVQIREGFSLLDLKRYVQTRGYKGLGFGQLDLNDLIERAPIMIPINALGYNHFVIFRGVMGDRVLLADPAWGNRTMTLDKFQRMWLDYGEPMGHVGFVVERADGRRPLSRLPPRLSEFVMLQ